LVVQPDVFTRVHRAPIPYAPPDRSKKSAGLPNCASGRFCMGTLAVAVSRDRLISDSSMRRGLNKKPHRPGGRRPPLLEQSALAARKSLATVVRPWLKCSQ
jgi:hypothetical protein